MACFLSVVRKQVAFVVPLSRSRCFGSARRGLRLPQTTEFRLVDAASREVTGLQKDRPVNWYACGPTVYDAAHLGHARTYVSLDLLRRAATRYGGLDIKFAMGVTDVDDKIIARAKDLGLEALDLARKEEVAFFDDMRTLGCLEPTLVLRVSEHVEDIAKFVRDIVNNGYAYTTDDGVWFDVAKLGDAYGIFAEGKGTSRAAAASEKKHDPKEETTTETNALASFVEEEEVDKSHLKRDRRDFALWKRTEATEVGWESEFGRGRPGWHIECSAMTRTAFGEFLDLHAGGVDLAFPHHENEVAQWQGVYGGPDKKHWCDCWAHTGHLHIAGRKMSKSLKNFITVKSLLEKTEPEDFRMFCATHNYASTVSYTEESVQEARRRRLELRAALIAAKDVGTSSTKRCDIKGKELLEVLDETRAEVRASLLNDLDAPAAVNALQRLATRTRQYATETPDPIREPIVAAATYLAETLQDLGFTETSQAWFATSTTTTETTTRAGREALDKLADFRAAIRRAALAADKDGDSRKNPLRSTILHVCDTLRDQDPIFKTWGLALVDRSNGDSALVPALEDLTEDVKKRPPPRPKKPNLDHIRPEDLFKDAPDFQNTFSAYDSTGFPTLDKDGNALSKSFTKKLKKRLQLHTLKWQQSNKDKDDQQ